LFEIDINLSFSKIKVPTDDRSPPPILIDYAPLACLCNSYLSAFNELW